MKFLDQNSGPDSPFAGLFSLLHLFQNAPGGPEINLTMQYVGNEPGLLKEFAGFIAGGLPTRADAPARVGLHVAPVATSAIIEMPWLFATAKLNGSGPFRRGKYNPNPLALLQVDSYGGQVNAHKPDETPIPQQSSMMKLQYQTYLQDQSGDAQNLDWLSGFYADMYGSCGPQPRRRGRLLLRQLPRRRSCRLGVPPLQGELRPAATGQGAHNVFHHKQSIRGV